MFIVGLNMEGYGKNWKGLLLLSMIVPIGLFTALKLGGLGTPLILETTRLSAVDWEFNRTDQYVLINKVLNATLDDACLMTFSTILGAHVHRLSFFPYYWMDFAVEFTALPRSMDFRLRDMNIRISSVAGQSAFDVQVDNFECENLSVADYNSGGNAYIRLAGTNSPGGAAFRDVVVWNLHTPNNVTEQTEIDFETTYYNGTAYKMVVQPFVLTLIGR